jgi:hypothetical protein
MIPYVGKEKRNGVLILVFGVCMLLSTVLLWSQDEGYENSRVGKAVRSKIPRNEDGRFDN